MELSVNDFMVLQPGYPQVCDTDKYYYVIAVHVARAWDRCGVLNNIDERVRVRVVQAVIGYYQDVVADAGLWRSFTSFHREQFGKPLPHFDETDDYIDFELNLDDLRFLIWYTLDYSVNGAPSPHDERITQLATEFYAVLDYDYVNAPAPLNFTTMTRIDINDPAELQATYDLTYWFYWRSYLMQGNAIAAADEAMPQAQAIISTHSKSDATPLLHDLNDTIMSRRPATVGPVIRPLASWLQKITE